MIFGDDEIGNTEPKPCSHPYWFGGKKTAKKMGSVFSVKARSDYFMADFIKFRSCPCPSLPFDPRPEMG
jgi:hypothetical protein